MTPRASDSGGPARAGRAPMKTRVWLLLFAALALLLGGLLVWQLCGRPAAAYAEVYSHGRLCRRVELSQPQRFTVECDEGYNVIVVENGTIRVAEADCGGNDCVRCGARSAGLPLVCLPHALEIRFSDPGGNDAVSR